MAWSALRGPDLHRLPCKKQVPEREMLFLKGEKAIVKKGIGGAAMDNCI